MSWLADCRRTDDAKFRVPLGFALPPRPSCPTITAASLFLEMAAMSVCRQFIPCSIAALALVMAGCGGNAAAPGTPVPPNRLAPPPENQPGGVAAPRRPAPSAPVVASSKNASTLPDGVDPRDAVEISAVGPTVEVLAPEALLPEHLVTVVATIPADSLNKFQVAPPAGAAGTTGTPATGFALPSGFQAIRAAGYSDSGLPMRIVDDKAGAEMVLVPAGVSYLGTDFGPENARPRVPVLLDPYYIDVTEVTLAEYDRYAADQKELKRGRPQEPLNAGSPPTFPSLGISWSSANAFAKWAGKDLPTEAEFEKAARGPDGFRAPWGNGRALWPDRRKPDTISPVASYRSDLSPYGAFDLAGNAREWCSDWYSDEGHREARASGSGTIKNWPGPRKATTTSHRVVKGGAEDWSAWTRAGSNMADRPVDVGFRCVLRVALPGESPAKTGGFRPPAASN